MKKGLESTSKLVTTKTAKRVLKVGAVVTGIAIGMDLTDMVDVLPDSLPDMGGIDSIPDTSGFDSVSDAGVSNTGFDGGASFDNAAGMDTNTQVADAVPLAPPAPTSIDPTTANMQMMNTAAFYQPLQAVASMSAIQ
jgi:hypothetical protein